MIENNVLGPVCKEEEEEGSSLTTLILGLYDRSKWK